MPKLDSNLKDYFTVKGTKIKIKNIQYSAISIALVFLILKKYFLQDEHGHWQRRAREGRGPLMCFSTSTRIVKTFQLSPTM